MFAGTIKHKMNNAKILIIEDSKVFAKYLEHLISFRSDYQVRTIHDPRQAMEVAEQFMPDLILTDFNMPHLNGNQVCTLLKASPKLQLIPVLMITENNSEDCLINAIECGADDFLYKNAKKEIVLIKVKAMLRHKELIDSDAKAKQFEAVNALIATTKHEFNNALFVSNGFLLKIKRKADPETLLSVHKLEEVNLRMYNLLKKLEDLRSIQFTTYADDEPMLKLE